MRILPIALAGAGLAIIAGGASITAVGASHQSSFSSKARSLESEWSTYQAEGVPAGSLAPLRAELESSQYQSAWWSPYWWATTDQALLSQLQSRTAAVWAAAVSAARRQAEAQIDAWEAMAKQFGSYVPGAAAAQEGSWSAELGAATTPHALESLATRWSAFVQQTTQQAHAAQLDAQVAGDGGVTGLLTTAAKAVATAQALRLDAGQVPALITAVQQVVAADGDASPEIAQLIGALSQLQSLISFNDSMSASFRPVMLLVDQAVAQDDPSGDALFARYQSAWAALTAAATTAQLEAVQSALSQLQTAVTTALAGDVCGHDVGSGKVITVNLTLQEIVFYLNGCVVQAAPVTTGRPLLRTPTGTFHIFYKQSPFEFISPWPQSSPFYYYPSWTNWVMEFDVGGYFIHDAPWEPNWEFGPGSENSGGASHGCIHVPSSVMQWAYSWTPEGTPVVISS